MFVFFIFRKRGIIKRYSSFEDVSEYKISWSHIDWYLYPARKFERPTITIFKSSVKENNNSDPTCRCVHEPVLYQTSFV
jgi:hypothetical protein